MTCDCGASAAAAVGGNNHNNNAAGSPTASYPPNGGRYAGKAAASATTTASSSSAGIGTTAGGAGIGIAGGCVCNGNVGGIGGGIVTAGQPGAAGQPPAADEAQTSGAETLLSSNARFQAISAIAVTQDGVINVADQGRLAAVHRSAWAGGGEWEGCGMGAEGADAAPVM